VINLSGSHLTFSTTEPVQLEVGETVQLPVDGFVSESSGLLPELESFEVELKKDSQGLGITIAGYVCERGNSGLRVSSTQTPSFKDTQILPNNFKRRTIDHLSKIS